MSIDPTSSFSISTSRTDSQSKDPMIQEIYHHVSDMIQTPQFDSVRDDLQVAWNTLVEFGQFQVRDADVEVRRYVHLQGIVEHVLSEQLRLKRIHSLRGVIHTPMPATPLCIKDTFIPEGVVESSVKHDPIRLATVKARETTVRDFLKEGGELFIVYPNAPEAKKRPPEALAIYQQALQEFPVALFDCPLPTSASLDSNLVGAFYLFKDFADKEFGFAIKMTQANSPAEDTDFSLWFAELEGSEVKTRIAQVLDEISPLSAMPLPEVR